MNALLYFNETTKTISASSGTWSAPAVSFGETMRIGIRFQKDVDGTATEISEDVTYLKAGIGNLDARPASGRWKLKIGDAAQSAANTTDWMAWNITAKALQTAINALTEITTEFGDCTVVYSDGSFFLKFGDGNVYVPLSLVSSELEPPCAALTNSWQVAGKWLAELRLTQAPACWSDSSERVLPSAPSITRIQAGYTDGTYAMNEIQQLTMPPDFRGSYQFKFGNIRTAILPNTADADAIASALSKFGDTITVTNPRDNIARIEFGGDFAGVPQALLEILVSDAPEGDLTFSLSLDTPALAAMLRSSEEITLPLEVEIGIADSTETTGLRIEKFRTEVTVHRGIIYGLLAAAQNVNWLRPMPTNYVPFTMDQIFRGQLYYAAAVGDGAAVEFVIDHDLSSDAIASVFVRENIADGRVLVLGTDFEVTYGGADSLTVTLAAGTTPPASAGLMVVITAAGTRDSFLQHTHTLEQIVGLLDRLESLENRVAILEDYIPTNTVVSSSSGTFKITIPAAKRVLFYDAAEIKLDELPVRAPYLLPAVHKATVEELPTPLPDPSAGSVWTAPSGILLPGNAGRFSPSWVGTGGFVASDGRMLYKATRGTAASSNSYFPSAFEQTLFEFQIGDAQLLTGKRLSLEFGILLQLVGANAEAQWVLVLEAGKPSGETSPAPLDPNFEAITWGATPLLMQRLYVTPLKQLHTFGVQIIRSTDGIAANQMRYGGWAVADATPESADFILRARLIQFDTRNNVHDARGWLFYGLGDTNNGTTEITATIS